MTALSHQAMSVEDFAMRNQKVLLPSLREQPAERFVLTTAMMQATAAAGLRVGVADQPALQAQPDEVLDWRLVSVLLSGTAGSGRSTFLGTALRQFAAVGGPCRVIVIDPTGATTEAWDEQVAGPATWFAMDQTTDPVVQLVEQLETLVVSPILDQRALVVIDRLDLVVLNLDQMMVTRLAKLISGASRSGIAIICTSDARTVLERELRNAFAVHYSVVDPDHHLLQREEPTYLVRPFVASHEAPAVPDAADLPLGPVRPHHLERAHSGDATERGDTIVLGVDDLTHLPVETPLSETLVVTGGSATNRTALITAYAGKLNDRGVSVGAIGSRDQVGALPDLIGTLVGYYDLLEGDDPGSKVETLLSPFEHIVVFEVDSLQRMLRERTRGIPRDNIATLVHTAISQRLGRGQLGVVAHVSFRSPPFQSVEWSIAHLQMATWVYLEPKPEVLIPGSGGGAQEKSLVAARPYRRYGADEGVCLIEGERHEIRGLLHQHQPDHHIKSDDDPGGVRHGQ